MSKRKRVYLYATLAIIGATYYSVSASTNSSVTVDPASLSSGGNIDERFQAYNVEMLEVTGGRFWKPYKDIKDGSAKPPDTGQRHSSSPPGMDPNLYEYRPPINLRNARLRKLAAALGPAYLRVSGTWANTTYFYDASGPAPSIPPKGFNGVLSREQWKEVIDFAKAVNAEIITSVAISAGTRNTEGVWTPDQAHALFSYTKSIGGRIAASEFMNEPNIASIGGAPKGYDAAAYARDTKIFRAFLKQASPETLFLGPGSVAENSSVQIPAMSGMLRSEDLLAAVGPVYDVFSYHLYPAVSERCAAVSQGSGTTATAALSEEWLSRPDAINAFYAGLRDRFEPGKPIWITETADAACGGNAWASTFLDTFRYLDEHARLAQQGVRVIVHNTLAASDYGLLDENTFVPRPNYWAALLWHKLMGKTVLKPNRSPADSLHLYAHCLHDAPGGVALLAINPDRSASKTLTLSVASQRYTLTASTLQDTHVQLNGKQLDLGPDDSIPQLSGIATAAGPVTLAPASITFLAVPEAHNASCR